MQHHPTRSSIRSTRPVAVALMGIVGAAGCLAGCGSSSSTSPTTAASASAPATISSAASNSTAPNSSASTSGQAVTLPVNIAGGKVGPNDRTVTVRKGQQVTVSIISDKATEVHVHGYNYEIESVPGQTVTRTFTANQTGSFEIETHDPAFTVYELQVD